ncbi:putative virulence factor [Thorsellia kenyensis]|uniref:Virulence factor n=1 Tax=Thorsellia kenyensis TaxID=1549888 RepID=A0ABV6C8G9_9GAMM
MINSLIPESSKMQLKSEQKALIDSWQNIYDGADMAINWIKETRQTVKRVDNEANSLTIALRRARNQAKSLSHAASLPMTVGFFGLSQAGKSYLISSLASSKTTGKLETQLGLHKLDFINHINPPGGGKEATGLVTRFSARNSLAPDDYPVQLRIFSEIEIAKILANSFYNDFNQEKIDFSLNEELITQHIKKITSKKSTKVIPGVDADDVVSLWDYMTRLAGKSQQVMKYTYWPEAIAVAPYLSIIDRAELFSLLWGGSKAFTEMYVKFAVAITTLKGAKQVFAPLTALVIEENGQFSQKDSIMNVDMLERLTQNEDDKISVLSVNYSEGILTTDEVILSLSLLAALTVELYVPLSDEVCEPIFDEVDLLDFPGYRGRLSLESLDELDKTTADSGIAQLFLRGKVAYLFERYTDNQEMNTLVMCTSSAKQSDVTSVGPVLDDWIKKTQGEDAATRSKRHSGLIWALTMFDMRVGQSLTLDPLQLKEVWGTGGLMKMAILERFGQYDWLEKWGEGPFNNTFLVRKPRLEQFSSIELNAGEEVAFNPSHLDKLALMKQTFCDDEIVQKHIAEPSNAWDAMLTLNDGGISRIIDALKLTTGLSFKLDRIREQLEQTKHDLVTSRLKKWYHSQGEEEVTAKENIAREIINVLTKQAKRHGEILLALMPNKESIERIYLQHIQITGQTVETESQNNVPVNTKFDPFAVDNGFGDEIDIFSQEPQLINDNQSNANTEAVSAHAVENVTEADKLFVQNVIQEWYAHLRQLPDNLKICQGLGIPKTIMELLTDEIINIASRNQVDQSLMNCFNGAQQIGVRRERIVNKQVFRVLNHLGDFLSWLGYVKQPLSQRPKSRFNAGAEIFQLPESMNSINFTLDSSSSLINLSEEPVPYTQRFVYDWFVALKEAIEENAGHQFGSEFTVQENQRLGEIISLMKP